VVNNNLNIHLPGSKNGKYSPKKYDFTCFGLCIFNLFVPQEIIINVALIRIYKKELLISFYLLSSGYQNFISYKFIKFNNCLFKLLECLLSSNRFKLIPQRANLNIIALPSQKSH